MDNIQLVSPINTPVSESNQVEKRSNNLTSVDPNTQGRELAYVKKKREYKAFIKLVREGKFTTAIFAAKALKVNRLTILDWLNTPRVLKAMNEDVDKYVAEIKQARDWKAKAYLLDRITKEDEDKPNQNLIIDNRSQTNYIEFIEDNPIVKSK